ncbi:MAG: hypothetical protein JWO67_2497 [Streptosporangiaceae bacterium]|jgi:uncharacterized protein YsxB (DUF464 family)|nr:hypothetical protein [Streptosporangiaceae bacterium]
MIRIRADLADGLTRVEVSGHEYGAADGRVCAAVSAIVQTALLGLVEIARQHPDIVSVEITQE